MPYSSDGYASSSQTNQLSQQKTFANVTKTNVNQFPSKSQAIVINLTPNIPTEDYIYAVGEITGPQNIIYVSRLSNDRLCIFLSKKELVDKIISEHSIININNELVNIRRYINPALRIILSNVCPSIPHTLIEEALINRGMKLVSPITFLKAGFKKEGYQHILSFRRQVFIATNEEDANTTDIPKCLTINHDNTDYKIYLSTGITCFFCHQKGHIADKCPYKQNLNSTHQNPQEENIQNAENTPSSQIDEQITKDSTESNKQVTTTHNIEENSKRSNSPIFFTQTQQHTQKNDIQATNIESTEINHAPTKQYATSISSIEDDSSKNCPEENNSLMDEIQQDKATHGKKKQKKNRSDSPGYETLLNIEEALKPFKDEMECNPKLYNITYENIQNFLEEAQNLINPLQTARKYTSDIYKFIILLKDIHGIVTDRPIKYRLTRITNKIREDLNIEAENYEESQNN